MVMAHITVVHDCSFNEATCDAQNGESCYPLVDEQGARAFCLTPCDPEATECADGLQCRRGDGDPADTFHCLPESDPNDWLERCDVDSPSCGEGQVCTQQKSCFTTCIEESAGESVCPYMRLLGRGLLHGRASGTVC